MNLWDRYMVLVKPPQMTSAQRRHRLWFYSGLIVLGVVLWILSDQIPHSAG